MSALSAAKGPASSGAAAPASAPSAAAAGPKGEVSTIGSKPTLIQLKSMKFLIMDTPRQHNLHLYIKECKKYNVTDIVRVCENTYNPAELRTAGIELHEMAYDDGTSPPPLIIARWLTLVKDRFLAKGAAAAATQPCIAVHCVAGLGRAPVMVALALIEYGECDPIVAVDFIRKHRRGAINEKQLTYLEKYVRKSNGSGCVIS